MNAREAVYEALEPVGIPVYFHAWPPENGKLPPPQYITFFEMLNQCELAADDEEMIDGHYIAVDIWSNTPTEEAAEKVRAAMKGMGAIKRDERDIYEEDTRTFHRAMTWWFFD